MSLVLKKVLKAFLRSRDLAFSLDFAGGSGSKSGGEALGALRWQGMDFFYRPGTSDSFVAYECMLHGKRNAYYSRHLPASDSVKTIVDIGANVGASVLYWKSIYPQAVIHCFEPIPTNFAVLSKNCEGLPGVFAHNMALGDADGAISLIHSPGAANEGGWSIFQRGAAGTEEKISIPIAESGRYLRELGLEKIDILKVDTEGAEKMIIKGLGDELLGQTGYICGELHGERDFELLDYLEQRGFLVGAKKNLRSVLFNFEAVRKK